MEPISLPPLKDDNSLSVSDAEKTEVFQTHFSKTFHPREDIYIPQQYKILLMSKITEILLC